MTKDTNTTSGAADLLAMVSKALREAYNLGQRYWQQADSEYISQHKKADDTRAKFLALVEETCAALAAVPAQAAAPIKTLTEAIAHAEDKAKGNSACAMEHAKLAAWLTELQLLRADLAARGAAQAAQQAPAGATELAEADRRAGAAERKLAASKEDVARIERVRDKMKDQWGVDRRVSFDVVWAEALALKAGTKSDSGVQEDAAWMPLTPELLTAIESGDLGNRFWIAAHNNNEPQIGVYEWRQGRNPHGFKSDLSRYGASEITHVLPYKPPALPAARKQEPDGSLPCGH